MRICRVFCYLATFIFSFALLAAAQDAHPNFTGIWKLDAQRSSLDEKAPQSVTLYIHQHDPDFHVRRTQVEHGKSSAWSAHGRTDGKTLETKTKEGMQQTHMYWQGSQLVLELQDRNKHGMENHKTVRYSLSDSGNTLIAQEKENNHENRWVFTKRG